MTDEEKKELEKLEKGDLMEMVSTLRATVAKADTKWQNERKEIIKKYLDGEPAATPATDTPNNDDDFYTPIKGGAIETLKRRFM